MFSKTSGHAGKISSARGSITGQGVQELQLGGCAGNGTVAMPPRYQSLPSQRSYFHS